MQLLSKIRLSLGFAKKSWYQALIFEMLNLSVSLWAQGTTD
jgi:hypothetical protein